MAERRKKKFKEKRRKIFRKKKYLQDTKYWDDRGEGKRAKYSENISTKWEEKKTNGEGKGGKYLEKGNICKRKIFGDGKGKIYSEKGNIWTVEERKKRRRKRGKYFEK